VTTFPWQREPTPPVPTPYSETKVAVKNEPQDDNTRFHNPALAAIRAQQQIREFTAMGELNGNNNGVEASLQALQNLAAEQQRKYEMTRDRNGSDGSTPDANWATSSANIDTNNALKRRISEVSDTETQPARPSPAIDPLPYYPSPSANTIPPVLNPTLNNRFPPTPPKRRPDPNDDTIGSDLDDSEDEGDIDSEDEDEDMPLMLCSYDKVNRTKNKWRANLSHGVVCINGREWVFKTGSGEYEW